MELQSLNIFIQVAELNSFTKAGEKLGYSQPTVSFQIKQLEKELGVQLFDRIGHNISLTDAGRDALVYAQSICNLSMEMLQGDKRDRELAGTVRIAMADSLLMPLIGEMFSQFKNKYPKVNIFVKNAGTNMLLELLDHNEADIVCTMDSHIYDTSYVIVNEEKINVNFVVSPDNHLANKEIINIEDLITEDFILTEKGMSYRRLLDENFARHSVEVNPVLEISNTDIICKLVSENNGISFLPDYVTEEMVKEGKLKRIYAENIDVVVWKQLLHRSDKWLSRPMTAVMEHLSSNLIK